MPEVENPTPNAPHLSWGGWMGCRGTPTSRLSRAALGGTGEGVVRDAHTPVAAVLR